MIVIEASAMVNALIGDPANPELLALLADGDLHAPALLDFEVASAIRGHAIAGKLTTEQLDGALQDFAALSIQRHHMTTLLGHILKLRDNFTAYDAAYVVLAQAIEAPVATSDSKLCEAERLGISVRVFS